MISSKQFVNVASFEKLVGSILADAKFVWQTELWLDPIERAKLDGAQLSRDQERIVARELLKASSSFDRMLATFIDLYLMYEETGAVLEDYDLAFKTLHAHKNKEVSLSELLEEAAPYFPDILSERGFPPELFTSVMDAAKKLGVPFDSIRFKADDKVIKVEGKGGEPCHISREPSRAFARVDGNTLVREGMLGAYSFVKAKHGVCETDTYQVILGLAKYGSESYHKRVRTTLESGLKPFKEGIAPIVAVLIAIVIIAIIAAVTLSILCYTKQVTGGACSILAPAINFIGAVAGCKLVEETDGDWVCTVTQGAEG